MKKRSLNRRGPFVLVFCAAAGLPGLSHGATDSWKQTAAGATYSWTDPLNWLSGAGYPSGVGETANVNIDIAGAQTISLNAPVTLGTLNLGDATTAFFSETLNTGTGGSLTFDVADGSAQLVRTVAVNPNLSDIINAPVILNDPLTVIHPWVNSGNGIQINGVVSGTGGITLTGRNYPDTGAGMVQFLDLTNPLNSFTGSLEIANGALVCRGNALLSANGALGNSAAPVLIGSANSVTGDGAPTLQNTTTAELRLQALDDSSNYLFERAIDFSGNTGNAAEAGRARFGITGNNAGVANTNTLTITGAVTLPSSTRGVEFLAVRQGQTLRFTGDINNQTGGSGTVFWGPVSPGLSASDGRQGGTYRFSDVERSYTNPQNLTGGTAVIEGNVGQAGLASPIGTQLLTLGDGNGGNMFTANTEGANRRIFLELAGTSYERALNPGSGSGSNLATAANISAVLPAVFQPLYGNSGSINLINGYEFGGLNTTDSIRFTGNISGQNMTVPATGTAGWAGGTNAVTVVNNIALTAATGGMVEFTGNISGSTLPVPGATDTPGAAVAANNTRITVNQFRNHPNLDTNVDGVPDANANRPVGTPTGGTVVLAGLNSYGGSTEILGGTLRLDYSFFDTSKLSDTAPLILSGGTLNLSGGFHPEDVASTILTAGTSSTVTASNAPAPINLNLITAQPGAVVNFADAGIATTDSLNSHGILGPWALINGNDFATNSTNADDGLITAYTAYTDVSRKASGTKVVPNNPSGNIRIVEGTGGTADLTLAAASTTINTLNQSTSGGTSAAVINTPGQTLAVNTIMVGTGAGGLTIGQGVLKSPVSGGALIIRNGSANPVAVSSTIEDNTTASGLSLLGTGTTVLTGLNTFTGTTSITGGTLQVGDNSTDGSLASQAILNNGALVWKLSADTLYSGAIRGTGNLTKDGPGKLTLTGASSGTGVVSIPAGTVELGNGGTTGAIPAGSTLTNSGVLAVNRSNAVIQGTDFPRLITGSGGLSKDGTGTLTLSGGNTYDGDTTVTAGVVAISHPAALGSTNGATVINSNGTLTTGGRVSLSNNIVVAENFTLQGTGDGSPPTPSYNGAITASSGNNTITGTITLTGTVTYRLTSNNSGTIMNYGLIQRDSGSGGGLTLDPSAGATLTVNEPIDNNGGNLTCHAGGLVILNAEANDVGNVTVQNGTSLRIGANEALPSNRNLQVGQGVVNGANGVNNDVGTFDLAGKSQTVNGLIGGPNLGTAVPNNATPSNRRLITSSLLGACVLTVGNGGGGSSFDGLIQNGAGVLAIAKTGIGVQTLTGPNTYTGDTSINGGTLVLGPNTSLADASAVRIDNSFSILQLADGATDTVAALFIDGVSKTGTWGSTLSGADNKDDEHFGGTGILSVSGVVVDPYTSWTASFGLQNPWSGIDPRLNGTPAADPDGDGRTNRHEYVFGLNPITGASANAIVSAPTQSAGLFTYTRRQPGLSGATFRYQWSTTLNSPWTDFTPDATSSNNAAPVELITVDLPNSLLPANPRLFVRVISP